MLLNLSNHPSPYWQQYQIDAALKEFGNIEDLPFPVVDASQTTDEVERLVDEYEMKVRKADPTAIHIMGELTFTYALVNRLKAAGYRCVASTTKRIVAENGNGTKTSHFEFVQFRDYF